ncbi:MAG: cysteine--tRNA ligase [Acholeplasmataceae bacterium]
MLYLYDSLQQEKRLFEPIKKDQVTMYVCGPTVYGDIHAGNARPVIFFDVLKRYLVHLGYHVTYASNITDVDDRIIEKAQQSGINELEITEMFTKNFLDVSLAIGSQLPDEMPKATSYIKEMIDYISQLIEKGHAYHVSSGVYFKVDSIKDYGILSKQNLNDLSQGVRITLDDEKKDPKDFTLWKTTEEGLSFESPWGRGRPGWHTECAAMNQALFDGEIDIHGGGTDLKFPHHENEIAQSMAINHHHLARFWMHVGRLDINQEKMSKSLGNITLVKDLIASYDPHAFRLLMVSHHYRQKINYSDELMVQYQKEYDKIKRTLKKTMLTLRLNHMTSKDVDVDIMKQFEAYMNDDLNTPNVLTLIQEVIKTMNKTSDLSLLLTHHETLMTILDLLGIDMQLNLSDDILETYQDWEKARIEKNYEKADALRQVLIDKGWI